MEKFNIFIWLLVMNIFCGEVKSQCSTGCNALASYYIWKGSNLTFISTLFSTSVNNIVSYNPQMTNTTSLKIGSRLNVPFSCGCVYNQFMGHQFKYKVTPNDSYSLVADLYYSDLTTVDMMTRFNKYPPRLIPTTSTLNVTVNCTCGNSSVSTAYEMFITYPLRPGESLFAIANKSGHTEKLLQDYNPGVDFGSGSGLVFIPVQNGTYPPPSTFPPPSPYPPPLAPSSSGISGGSIAGISIAAVVGVICLALCFYFVFYRRKKVTQESFLHKNQSIENANGSLIASTSPLKGITVDKSVEFTYEELRVATNGFNKSNIIGQGGFGSVYYAEVRGEKAAIKKMDMEASKEFLAELKVLTRVHHVNLVRLIGYCVENSLCLVYEYIDNGNLSQHLRGKGTEPLTWSTRVQIALDSARGLEYIHEHTVPAYIHRDIKSANILIDNNSRAKVADFGLAKLTGGGNTLPSRLMGTFGYMPPEYIEHGEASRKIDVYVFGVVLLELISAKEAVVMIDEIKPVSKSLVSLFENAFNDQINGIRKLVDPRLGDDYPLDSIFKVGHLAKACTHKDPQVRPRMRSLVVELMTLSSSTED